MKQYLDAMRDILENGTASTDRTGTGTIRSFGQQMRFDLSKGFPLVTTKRVHMKSIIHELLWFLKGDTNIRYLQENGVTIWDEWADENGDLGPVYGHQWRRFGLAAGEDLIPACDQIQSLVDNIKKSPDSRRLLVSGWNPRDLAKQKLPPCHTLWQVLIIEGRLNIVLFQRSGDFLLGLPFNIASYALLGLMLAHVTGYEPGEFVHFVSDAHIYANHVEQVKLQLGREPRELPQMRFARQVTDIFDFRYEDFILEGYDPHPPIKAPVAV